MKEKHIKLFEQYIGDNPKSSGMVTKPSDGGEYVTCIGSDGGWNAAGILLPNDEKYVQDLQMKDPDGITVEYFPVDSTGSFLFLSGLGGGFQICNDGDMYDSKDGYVFPIISYKLYVMSANGHTVDFDIIDAKDIYDL